jgi:hypothetical protein
MSRAHELYVVAVVSNPVRWNSRNRLYREFAQHVLDSGAKLLTVECAFGDRPFELNDQPHVQHVGVRASGAALVWSKENMANIGISRLPPEAQYIATLDADIRFHRPDWASETVEMLQHFPVLQPWSDCYDTGPIGEHLELHRSFCRLYHERQPIVQGPHAGKTPYRFAHPGFAWAYTRQALDQVGGLIETAALGAADHHMALALIGRVDESIPGQMSEGYKKPLHVWQQRAVTHIARNISFVPGTITHNFHGAKKKRYYVDRWNTLIKHGFDPATDLRRNSYGVFELALNKPELRHDIFRYFTSRNEDSVDAE